MLVEVVEVVTLKELVGELCEGKAVACLTIETLLNGFLCHHVVDGDVLADVPDKVEELEVLHPVVVVHQFCAVGCIAVEIKEMRELLFDASDIVAQGLLVEQVALGALARRVANHACGTANKGEGLVAATLKMAEHHHAAKVSDVERVGGGVDSEVCRHLLLLEQFVSAGHHLVYHSTPCEFLYEIFHYVEF